MTSRDQARRGWFATPKDARDAIRTWYDGAETCATALAVFDALCEIANDKGSAEFVTDQPWIASKAGCSARTVRARLRDLEGVGVVRSVVPKLRGPATFTIAPLNSVPPFGNNVATFGDNCPTFGKDARQACLPTSEEHQKIFGTITQEGASRRERVRFAPPSRSDWIAFASTIGFPDEAAGQAFNHYESNGWRVGRNPMRNWQAACRTCHGRWKADNKATGAGAPAAASELPIFR